LPRKAQRKADELLRKLMTDPRQASIHYEPIRGAHDRQLRSLRVGDDYRAVIRAPETGEVFLLLWVDHHDEAYRWAASKQTEVHPATGTLQLFDVEGAARALTSLGGEETERQAPQGSAPAEVEGPRLFAAFTDDEVFHAGVPRALIPAVRAVLTEVDLDQLLPHLPTEAAQMLTGLAAGFTLDALLEETLGRTSPPSQTPSATVDASDVDAALTRPSTQQQFRIVDGEFDLDAALANPLDVWRVYLHPKQRLLARARTKGPMRVTGGAGTGKTVVALHRAAFLVREVFTKPDDRVLFTTFTVNLAHDVRRQLEKLLEPKDLARVEVKNLDSWASDYLHGKGEALRVATDDAVAQAWTRVLDVYAVDGVTPEFCKTEWREVVQAQDLTDEEAYVRSVRLHRGLALGRRERRQLWPLFQGYRQELSASGVVEYVEILRHARKRLEADAEAPRYRAVVVDETQDLSLEALRLVRAIAGPEHPDDLFLVGDAHQRIYGRAVPLGSAGINVRGRRSQELRLNYRTTAAICRWSLGALGAEEMDDLDDGPASRRGYVSLREGQPPSLHVFEHAADEVGFVVGEVQRLLASGTPPEGICITARRASALRDRFLDALGRAGIVADVLDREEPRHPSVRLATMHRIKGLEFPVVFVVGVNEGEMPLRIKALETSDPVVAHRNELAERCLLYVAASRARDALFVSSFGTPSPFLVAMGAPPVAPSVVSEPAPLAPLEVPVAAAVEEPRVDVAIAIEASTAPVGFDPGQTLLDSLVLPARMVTWLNKKGLTTARELASIAPRELIAERNLGRRTLAETRAVLEKLLGFTWEEASEKKRAVESAWAESAEASSPTTPMRWDQLRVALPESLRKIGLDEIAFPARVPSYAEREGLLTLGDLATRSEAELKAAPNLGRKSVQQIFEAVQEHLTRIEAGRERAATGLLESWKSQLQEQDSVRRMVLTLRAGLGGRGETLQSIAELIGVTRERVRQIEKAVLEDLGRNKGWIAEVRARVDAALSGSASSLEVLAADPWWAGIVAVPEALDYFGERLLGGAFRVVELEEHPYAARCSQDALDESWTTLKRAAAKVPLPAAVTLFEALAEPLTGTLGKTLSDLQRERLKGMLHLEDDGGNGPRVVGFGSSHSEAMLAILRTSPVPVRMDDVFARTGRGSVPEEILFFGSGLVGMEHHFPDFKQWMDRLVPAAIQVMEREAPERQWLAHELIDELREDMELPTWMTHWHLGSLLRRSGKVRYLGRLRVSLLASSEDQGRVKFHDELLRILRARGEPMVRDELVGELSKKTSVTELTMNMCLSRSQFLRCGDDRIGLLERDLPGGTEALAEAVEHTAALLEHRQRGLGAAQLWAEVTKLSQTHAQWTREMCMSVLRGDSRFRSSQSGAVGLSSWETVRVPNRLELLRQCIEEAGGRVSVDAVQRRIEAYFGEASSRVGVGLMANRLGAALRGEWIERESPE
jgi:superfamily I DNA/RNA helicase/mRNA-degrading endonuclease RelE of RelBE toxin-antitoxin system